MMSLFKLLLTCGRNNITWTEQAEIETATFYLLIEEGELNTQSQTNAPTDCSEASLYAFSAVL